MPTDASPPASPDQPPRYAFFGPTGTFTEAALRTVAPAGAPADPYPSVDATIAAVRSGLADIGVVPIENSVEGGVSATLDGLAAGDPLLVVGEVVIPVTFVLAARPGTALADVRTVSTHSHAHAQVRRWLDRNLQGARYLPSLSTAAAAAGLAEPVDAEAAGYDAAVCAPLAAARFGLEVLAEDIGDTRGAETRFVLLARPAAPGERPVIPAPTGADKTSLVAFLRADHPGALIEVLEQFVTRGINLSRIESRPTGDALGRYSFSIDCEGHVAESRVGEALMGLHRICERVRFLGSYPQAGSPAVTGSGPGEEAFAAAESWLQRVRAGRSV
ncbi:prephenate dehydratase [Kineococcus xinjiangensis]|uniref:Prephenate dehydratase n=1 Tax=Kineococcus xinjiangensis TaxID=512762 RepID=A0A2S6IG68_9ACTN|nr:prephenate dehydratase [Kineococcus xinjiangensis]PPK93186.1 prephenate dehydratase [Kineococcus xinjiangensis]